MKHNRDMLEKDFLQNRVGMYNKPIERADINNPDHLSDIYITELIKSEIKSSDLYFKLLKPDGILCVNISNWHLALEPYVKRIGLDFNCPLLGLYAEENVGQLGFAATVAIFCRDPKGMSAPPISRGEAQLVNFNMLKAMKDAPTDEKGSFLPLLRIFLPSGPN